MSLKYIGNKMKHLLDIHSFNILTNDFTTFEEEIEMAKEEKISSHWTGGSDSRKEEKIREDEEGSNE